MNYLVDNGYEYSVSPKILSRPSTKDFNQIVTFLLRQVDPTFHNHNSSNSNNHHHHVNYEPNLCMKFEDEVAMAFKGLGYRPIWIFKSFTGGLDYINISPRKAFVTQITSEQKTKNEKQKTHVSICLK